MHSSWGEMGRQTAVPLGIPGEGARPGFLSREQRSSLLKGWEGGMLQ